MLDWDANVNPDFGDEQHALPEAGAAERGHRPPTAGIASSGSATARSWYSAKELTVLPKRTVTIKDRAAYGVILTQGYGTIGRLPSRRRR